MGASDQLQHAARILSIASKRDDEKTPSPTCFLYRDKSSTEFLSFNDIIRLEASGNYTIIHLRDGTHRIMSQALKHVTSKVPQDRFTRIHQSHVISNQAISRIEGSYVHLHCQTILPIARRRRSSMIRQVLHSHTP